MPKEIKLRFGNKKQLHSDYGLVSFGMLISGCFMNISSERAKDLEQE